MPVVFDQAHQPGGDAFNVDIWHAVDGLGLQSQVDRVIDIIHCQEVTLFRQGDLGREQVQPANLCDPDREFAQTA